MKMRRNLKISSVALAVGLHATPALASGDPSIVFIPAGHLALAVLFLLRLPKWQGWGRRLVLASWFFGAMVASYFVASAVPFSANSHWLVPSVVAAPAVAWAIGSVLLRRRPARVA